MENLVIGLAVLSAGLMVPLLVLRLLAKEPKNLGVVDGRLLACPASPNCVSSQAEDEAHYLAPIPFSSSTPEAMDRIAGVIRSMPGTEIVAQTADYLYARFTTGGIPRWTDDVEFHAPPGESVIHFRSSSRVGYSDWGKNRKRMEAIKAAFMGS